MAATPPSRLLLQLLRLARAQFDMRSARDLSFDLERAHDHISPRAYGLYTGLAVSYARPFTEAEPYGSLESKWSTFRDRPDFLQTHARLLDHRNRLLAHNDVTGHRVIFVWPHFNEGRPAIVEGRSPINAPGVQLARELFAFQEKRFGDRAQEIADELQATLGWAAGELDLDAELRRLRGSHP